MAADQSERAPEPTRPVADSFLDEIRAVKDVVAAESGGNMARHIERLREMERRVQSRIVRPPDYSQDRVA